MLLIKRKDYPVSSSNSSGLRDWRNFCRATSSIWRIRSLVKLSSSPICTRVFVCLAEPADLVRNFAGEVFGYGPGCESRESKTSAVIEFFDRTHQRNIALADQVEQVRSAECMFACDVDDEPQVCFDYSSIDVFGLGQISFYFS